MKTRLGYVSNSSSSSFVVVIVDDRGEKSSVTDYQEALLRSYGFKYVKGYWKHALAGTELFDDRSGFSDGEPVSMYYDVSCDEGDVEDFLFENRIPFVESEEYDTRIVHYDGRHDWYERILNEGNRLLMYCFNGNDECDEMEKRFSANRKPFSRIRISDGADVTDETFSDNDGRIELK